MTAIRGSYSALTCTNLTQTITRSGSRETPFTAMVTGGNINFSRTLTLTVFFNTGLFPPPTTLSLISTTPEIVLNRINDQTYTITSNYTKNSVNINNHAYFNHLLRNLVLRTDPLVWPSPNFDILMTLTDGTTTLNGTIVVSVLNAVAPTTPVLSISPKYSGTNTLVWIASTQPVGPGLGGYYIYKNGNPTPYATVSAGTLNWSEPEIEDDCSYTVRSFDLSSPEVLSASSNTVSRTYFVAVGTRSGTAGSPTVNPIYKSSNGTSWSSAYTPSVGTYGWSHLRVPTFGSLFVPTYGTNPAVYSNDGGVTLASTFTTSLTGGVIGGFNAPVTIEAVENNVRICCLNSTVDKMRYSWGPTVGNAVGTLQTQSNFETVRGANGRFFRRDSTGATTNIFTSTNGSTWTSFASPNGSNNFDVIGNGTRYLFRFNTEYYTSTDLVNFTLLSLPSVPTTTLDMRKHVEVINGIWLATTTTSDIIMRSTDGINWSNITLGTSLANGIFNFTQNYFILNQGTKIAYSTNGSTWTVVTPSITLDTDNQGAISYCNGRFFNASFTDGKVYSSPDLITWSTSYTNANILGNIATL